LLPETNSIFETFLSEIIFLGKLLGKPVENYEEHFYTQITKWYNFELKELLPIRGIYEWNLGLWLLKKGENS